MAIRDRKRRRRAHPKLQGASRRRFDAEGASRDLNNIRRHLHVAAAYVTSEVSRLVAKGPLTKRRDKLDRRAVSVGLTKNARDLLARLERILGDVNRPLFSGLSFRDLASVHRFLRAIIENGSDAIRVAQRFESGFRPRRKGDSLGRSWS